MFGADDVAMWFPSLPIIDSVCANTAAGVFSLEVQYTVLSVVVLSSPYASSVGPTFVLFSLFFVSCYIIRRSTGLPEGRVGWR